VPFGNEVVVMLKDDVTVSVVEPLIGFMGGLLVIGVLGVTPVPNGAIVPQVAVIVALPDETPLARPAAVIVATPEADEPQTTQAVRFCVPPPLKRPVAVNCCVPPERIDGFAGVTAMEINPFTGPGCITTWLPDDDVAAVNVVWARAHEPGMSRKSRRTVPPKNRLVPYFACPKL
jgi:hypothetical protein